MIIARFSKSISMSVIVALRFGQLAAVTFFLSACDGNPTTPAVMTTPDTFKNIFQTAISEPVASSSASIVSASRSDGTVYVAFSEGELPDVQSVRISNISARIDATAAYAIVNGALDPVAISANVGDTLELRLRMVDGTTAALRAVVPAKRPPRVIRTDPPKGRTDVAVNSRIRVVFSEPIDPASISASSLRLSRAGEPVQGSFVLDGPPTLSAEFVPAQPLVDEANYVLEITTGIRDLSGDALPESIAILFTTAPFIRDPGFLVVRVVTAGVDQDYDGYTLQLQGGAVLPERLHDEPLIRKLRPGTYTVTLADVASNCAMTGGGATRQVLVVPAQSTSIDYEIACTAIPGQPVTGQKVVFVSDRDGNNEIYVANADGSGVIRLTFDKASDTEPAWSPDGSRIAFVSTRAGNAGVFIMNADGSRVRRVHVGHAPAWSPDGSKIAFATYCRTHTHPEWGSSDETCIKVISADGDGSDVISLSTERGFSGQPAWSPDGREIAFVSDMDQVDEASDIFVARPDGSSIRQLTHGYADLWSARPAYSPEGRIAFVSARRAFLPPYLEEMRLAIMNADGTGLNVVTVIGVNSWGYRNPPPLTWSPDGGSIAFSSGGCVSSFGPCPFSISIIRPDGGAPQVVIPNAHSPSWRR